MKPPLLEKIHHDTHKRESSSLFRTLPEYCFNAGIDLASNSYLDLHNNLTVKKSAVELAENCFCGNLASRLIAQNSPLYEKLEKELADWKDTESALLFNSGYAANTGMIQALCGRHTDIFCDKLNHASIIDGCRLSGGRLVRYRHNDMADLERLLKKSDKAEKMIISDSVFSMDGDRAPLENICELGEKYGCVIMVDEAHATGIFGTSLSGLVEKTGMENRVHIRIGTLSKAVAGLGGFFAGSDMLKKHLVNNARSLIYSTGLPHTVLAYDLAAVQYIRRNSHIGVQLLKLADKFRSKLNETGFDCMKSSTQIVPVRVNGSEKALALSNYLKENGITAPAIRPPTVPEGTERIRFSLHLGIDSEDIEKIVRLMKTWEKQNG
ncbi:MAG: aminotransferase class I/II-fold pyridoxal phosphate-dependent enzyme [Chitinispirillaceae bacterium]